MQKLKPVLFFCLVFLCSAKNKTVEKVQWLDLDQVKTKIKEQSKPVLIDLYTDWCYWCKVMDKKTYSNKKVIDYINEHFYSARVNAETKEALTWNDITYNFNDNYKINDFALFVTYGEASFPTTIIIVDENTAPVPVSGFLEPKEMESILKYYGEGYYKTQTFPDFQKAFKSKW